MTTAYNCPQCQKEILWNQDFPYRPFCCKRCQLIDLGEWANEKHIISDSRTDQGEDEFNEFSIYPDSISD